MKFLTVQFNWKSTRMFDEKVQRVTPEFPSNNSKQYVGKMYLRIANVYICAHAVLRKLIIKWY